MFIFKWFKLRKPKLILCHKNLQRKGNPNYDNKLTNFMPRLIYIKKSFIDESVSCIGLIFNLKYYLTNFPFYKIY